MNNVARILIDSVYWASLRSDSGSAVGVPQALWDLFSASSEDAAEAAYWRIDNEVIVQGQLHEAAVPTLEILLCMAVSVPSGAVRRTVAELIQQMVFGQPHPSEMALGNSDIASECQRLARGAIWVFYDWLSDGDSDVRQLAILILRKVEPDARRWALVMGVRREVDKAEGVQRIFSEIDRGLY